MDQPPASGVGGGSGGPAPFLLKTYDMVDDSSTDEIVSWCPDKKNSFVVWNPPEFARLLLPTYFKHNNFSSFIRQLNTYGFRKIDPERWEFANEDFVKDQKHLLKNIHRRKPIHSHSQPPGSTVDPERVAFEEEIERLSREKTALEANILRCSQQRSAVQVHFEELTQRFDCMERRQESLLTFLEKAVQEPTFVEHLARKLESADVLAYKKKRRLPQADQSQPAAENNLLDDDSSARPEPGSIFDQDFSDKLRLELSPAVSDVNLVSCSTQSSNDDGPCPLRKTSERDPKDTEMRTECPLFAPEPLDISDTGTSFGLKMDSYFPQKVRMDGGSEAQLLHQRFGSCEDADVNVSCQLKLALASSPFQANRNPFSSRTIQQVQEIGKLPESDSNTNTNTIESGTVSFPDSRDAHEEEMSKKISMEAPVKNQEHAAKPVRVNDVFWEQFLTERPGSSDNEEACSSYRANAYEEQEERRSSNAISKSFKSLEQLTL